MEEITKNCYDEQGNCIGDADFQPPPPPKRMAWDLKHPDIATAIQEADSDAQKLLNDLHLHIFTHDDYGKGFMKKCQLSPDAYLQMALQLAYYRDAGRFSLTYEASITRLFREGRTETVRPCTVESAAWVSFSLVVLIFSLATVRVVTKIKFRAKKSGDFSAAKKKMLRTLQTLP